MTIPACEACFVAAAIIDVSLYCFASLQRHTVLAYYFAFLFIHRVPLDCRLGIMDWSD